MATTLTCTTSSNTPAPLGVLYFAPTSPIPVTANLTCDIHPLFAYKNWQSLSLEDYELIMPGLRLATMYLSTPSCLAFFATCLFSKRDFDDDWHPLIEKESQLTPFKAERVKEMLLELDGVIKFTYQNINCSGLMQPNVWRDFTDDEQADIEWNRHVEKSTPWSARKSLKHGKTVDKIEEEEMEFVLPHDELDLKESDYQYRPPDEEPRTYVQDPRTRMTFCTIIICGEDLRYLKWRRYSPEQSLRENLRLAGTILHELAHAVERGRPEAREWHLEEAKFPGSALVEMGRQLEMAVFGGIPDAVKRPNAPGSNCERDNTWTVVTDWPLRPTSQVYDVPLEFLARIQQQEYWDQVDFSVDQSSYKFPRTESRSDSLELCSKWIKDMIDWIGEEYATAHYVIPETSTPQ